MAKGTHGGSRPNSGRPSAIQETRKKELFHKHVTDEDWRDIFKAAVDLAKGGDSLARDWLTNHGLGKAKEIKEIAVTDQVIKIGYSEAYELDED